MIEAALHHYLMGVILIAAFIVFMGVLGIDDQDDDWDDDERRKDR